MNFREFTAYQQDMYSKHSRQIRKDFNDENVLLFMETNTIDNSVENNWISYSFDKISRELQNKASMLLRMPKYGKDKYLIVSTKKFEKEWKISKINNITETEIEIENWKEKLYKNGISVSLLETDGYDHSTSNWQYQLTCYFPKKNK